MPGGNESLISIQLLAQSAILCMKGEKSSTGESGKGKRRGRGRGRGKGRGSSGRGEEREREEESVETQGDKENEKKGNGKREQQATSSSSLRLQGLLQDYRDELRKTLSTRLRNHLEVRDDLPGK
mgnify:CR=1 FL=1